MVYVQDFSTNGTYLTRASDQAEQLLSRRDGKVLLGPGDRIRISPLISLTFDFTATVDPHKKRLPSSQRREAEVCKYDHGQAFAITNWR